MDNIKPWKYGLSFVSLIAILIWFAVFSAPESNLHIVACDVGQGDAFLIYEGTTQILVDGGPNNRVQKCLGENMPFWDRTIELVILTHPQNDHYFGLIEVIKNYDVEAFLGSSVDNDTKGYTALKNEIENKDIKIVNPDVGMNLRLGEMKLEIVWPNLSFISRSSLARTDVATRSAATNKNQGVLGTSTTKKDLNDFSIVFNLSYGQFDALFTGDIGPKISNEILNTGLVRDVEYLKIPHHGSKNGLTQELLDASQPEIAVISVGKDNRFGHPRKETLKILEGIKVLRTDMSGEVVTIVDNKNYWVQ